MRVQTLGESIHDLRLTYTAHHTPPISQVGLVFFVNFEVWIFRNPNVVHPLFLSNARLPNSQKLAVENRLRNCILNLDPVLTASASSAWFRLLPLLHW